MRERDAARVARKALDAMKSDLFKSLDLTSTPRTEAVFELAAEFVMWSIVDGQHTSATVMPYLSSTMTTYMTGGAYRHLDRSTTPTV